MEILWACRHWLSVPGTGQEVCISIKVVKHANAGLERIFEATKSAELYQAACQQPLTSDPIPMTYVNTPVWFTDAHLTIFWVLWPPSTYLWIHSLDLFKIRCVYFSVPKLIPRFSRKTSLWPNIKQTFPPLINLASQYHFFKFIAKQACKWKKNNGNIEWSPLSYRIEKVESQTL